MTNQLRSINWLLSALFLLLSITDALSAKKKSPLVDENIITSKISVVTAKKVGELIALRAKTISGDITVEGATFHSEVGQRYYRVVSNPIVIKGRVSVLDISNNDLTSIDLSEATDLLVLACDQNHISSVIFGEHPSNLRELLIGGNPELIDLDLSQATKLGSLSCYNTGLTQLNLSANTNLRELYCRDNDLRGVLDLSHQPLLELLSCYQCQLTHIKLHPQNKLRQIELQRNHIGDEAMRSFVEALPTFAPYNADEWDNYRGYNPQGFYAIDPTEREGNICLKAVVDLAKAKDWPVFSMEVEKYGEEKPEPYEGQDLGGDQKKTYQPTTIRTLASYMGQPSTRFTSSFSSQDGFFFVELRKQKFRLSLSLDTLSCIQEIILYPQIDSYSRRDWINFVSLGEADKKIWGNFLGTKFLGAESGIKQDMNSTIDLVNNVDISQYRITPLFNPISGVYFTPEIESGIYAYRLVKSYYSLQPDQLMPMIGSDYQALHQKYYYISNQIKAWGMNYIYFAYARDHKGRVFDLKAIAAPAGETIYEVDCYLNDTDNRSSVAPALWLEHAKGLVAKYPNFELFATNTFGDRIQNLDDLDAAESFIKKDNRRSGVILRITENDKQLNWVINAKSIYYTTQYRPANVSCAFELPEQESLSLEVQCLSDSLRIDWGDGKIEKVKAGLISGKYLGSTIKLYGDISSIDCSSSKLKSLQLKDVEGLTQLYCSNNHLSTLDISNCSHLEILDCEGNQLKRLSLELVPHLKSLLCGQNQITELNLSKLPQLTRLSCAGNQLTSLDLSHLPLLNNLICSGNQLSELSPQDNKELVWLVAKDNQLQQIDISKNARLVKLDLTGNKLTKLDLSNQSQLEILEAQKNELQNLTLGEMPALREMNLSENTLSSLDYARLPNVMRLSLSNNNLTDFGLSANLRLRDLHIDGNNISAQTFEQLVSSLYSRKGENVTGNIYILSESPTTRRPQLTKEGMKVLREKNWELYKVAYLEDGSSTVYALTEEEINTLITEGKNTSPVTNEAVTIAFDQTSCTLILSEVCRVVEIYSVDGILVRTMYDISSGDLSALSKGIYLVRLNGSDVHKILIQH